MGTEIGTGHTRIYIGPLPGRKQECVAVQEGSTIYVCAYLRNAEERDRLLAAIRTVFRTQLWED